MLIITCIDLSCQYILYIMMVTPVLGRTHDRQLGRMSTTWKPVRLGAGPPLSGKTGAADVRAALVRAGVAAGRYLAVAAGQFA